MRTLVLVLLLGMAAPAQADELRPVLLRGLFYGALSATEAWALNHSNPNTARSWAPAMALQAGVYTAGDTAIAKSDRKAFRILVTAVSLAVTSIALSRRQR